ncbi:MAG: apolipoprotein N-acyltransferase, partial [Alphaproteobacteria bacterium]|nr:apolipoprotein N-acyltransferase [Alphaproteobacteria bacterium]
LLVLAWGGGALRLAGATDATVPGVRLRLVQPDIPQREKWRTDLRAAHFRKHLALSEGAAAAGVTQIIWPEAATPFLLLETPDALRAAATVVPPGGALITGTPRRIDATHYGNAVVALDDRGRPVAVYDKHHLVPFGEYVPLREWLPLERLAQGRGDFTPGPGAQTLVVPGAPSLSPLVCYEAIFPGAATDASDRPGWLLNVTNDAWFGASAGPHQHLAIARLRAIEEGLPMVRVANTGISAIIDPYGRILAHLPLDTEGVIDAALPTAIALPLYAVIGDGGAIVLALALVLYWYFAGRNGIRAYAPAPQ